jgi:hypothetical protein
MRHAILLDLADGPEAGLLERAQRAAIRFLDGRDTCDRRRVGEDDALDELRQDARPQAAADRV